MLQLVLAVSVVVVAVVVHGSLGLRWWWRARLRRRILALVAGLDLEPYHAAALEYEETPAAAAELMLDGYLDIDAEGVALLTEAGRDPGRTPVEAIPAALLEALRRHDPEPVSIGWIDRRDEEYQSRCLAYREERDALLPGIPRMPAWDGRQPWACCSCLGFVLLGFFWLLVAEMLVIAPPHGLREWAAAVVAGAGLAALAFRPAAGRAVRARTECGDAFRERLRATTHPAIEALDEQQRQHVRTSADDHGRWRGLDRFVPDEDEDDDAYEDDEDEWWGWGDAYHYRAADHEDDPDTT
ncbi:hypothetical protein [Streptomyces sp. NRRL S-241]|uniref:hypothetical protein n=1 Tax=Streptomyces sp. NRRL S-241 TaxID=1463896 RepID=UPI0004C19669|nr:hypothetical protein [Streptomyces sp. NRRL S-241]